MLELGAVEQVPDNSRVFGDGDAYGIFDCPHRGQVMGVGSDPAGALHKKRSIQRVSAL
jgi:hypothetical protein